MPLLRGRWRSRRSSRWQKRRSETGFGVHLIVAVVSTVIGLGMLRDAVTEAMSLADLLVRECMLVLSIQSIVAFPTTQHLH